MCGVVEDGIIPGLYGYEAGQAAVGDIFAWFVENAVPPECTSAAEPGARHAPVWRRRPPGCGPARSGLVALDWWNGNRSILVDADLTGLLVGATLATRPPDIYRALLEATAFGTRVIIEALECVGRAHRAIVACGGLPDQNRLLMQLYGRRHGSHGSPERLAPGARARLGDVRRGRRWRMRYASIADAAARMAASAAETYQPRRSRHGYDALYAEYVRLHDLFGRGGDDVMKTLKRLRSLAGS